MSLVAGTIEEAVTALAQRFSGRLPLEKRAEPEGFLGGIGRFFHNQPELASALAGGGLGAAAGGIGTAVGNRGKDESERRSVLGSMVTGGLAGGALGGGLGMASRGLRNIDQHSERVRPQTFTGPDGRPMQVNPEAIRQNPGLGARVRELNSGSPPATAATLAAPLKAMDSVTSGLPVTRLALPAWMGADALLHSRLNLGERFGLGRIRPEFSTDPSHLARGIADVGDKLGIPPDLRQILQQRLPAQAAGGAGTRGMQTPDTHTEVAPGVGGRGSALNRLGSSPLTAPPGDTIWQRLRSRLSGNLGSDADPVLSVAARTGGSTSVPVSAHDPAMGSHTSPNFNRWTLNRGQVMDAKRRGFEATFGKDTKNAPALWRTLSGGTREVARPWMRFAGRSALAGTGMAATELMANSGIDSYRRSQELHRLMSELGQPVPGQ